MLRQHALACTDRDMQSYRDKDSDTSDTSATEALEQPYRRIKKITESHSETETVTETEPRSCHGANNGAGQKKRQSH